MNAQDTLEKFLEVVKNPETTLEEAKKYLTVTQQETSVKVSGIAVDGGIVGVHQFLNAFNIVSITPRITTNKMVQDFKIKVKHKELDITNTYNIRLIKEKALRKPSPDGTWGININSLKKIN